MYTYSTAEMAATEEMLSQFAVAFAGIMGVYIAVAAAVLLVIAILMVLSTWKIFKKAGQKGWKAIIPIYSDYTFYKIAWKKRWFWVMLVLAVIATVVPFISDAVPEFAMIEAIVSTLIGIVIIVIEIIMNVKLAKAFRKDGGFAVGLILLPFIFYPILAFGSARYRKKKKRRRKIEPLPVPEEYGPQ